MSILGGPEHYNTWGTGTQVSQRGLPRYRAALGGKISTNVAAYYSHLVSGAGGLIGTYHSDLNASWRHALSRMWDISANVNYSLFDNVNKGAPPYMEPGATAFTAECSSTTVSRKG